jgi:Tol biopolymer transport system component
MIRFHRSSIRIKNTNHFERLRGAALLIAAAGCILLATLIAASPASLGDFEGESDVGGPLLAGSSSFDVAHGDYHIIGGGANMWKEKDAFHYLWRRASGDVTLTAQVNFPHPGGNAHRKAGWMVRQALTPGAPYADLVMHGSGLTALQYRLTEGGTTQEIQSKISNPQAIRLVRLGNSFSLWAAAAGGQFELAGTVEVPLHDPVYVGLAVCAHDAAKTEEATFSSVSILGGSNERIRPQPVESRLEIISVDGHKRRVVYHVEKRFEAPNWSRDGKVLLFNMEGKLYTVPVKGGEPKLLDTGEAIHCNNDHGLSPDGKWLAITNSPNHVPFVYVLPSTGGTPRQVTQTGPSYWHGWSPDGKTLAFAGIRNGNGDIYSIPVEGGADRRLTDAPGLDDGPDYSPDGQYIYFNSERTGWMQIWRMHPDGSAQEQVTRDDYANWFAHPSPDGKWIVLLSYNKTIKGHPADQDVMLRLMPAAGGEPHVLVNLFGGQGTINVPSWSPDSKRLAFVSYRLLQGGRQ